jgi:competence ComEA-like helix-hairpin-helix protein
MSLFRSLLAVAVVAMSLVTLSAKADDASMQSTTTAPAASTATTTSEPTAHHKAMHHGKAMVVVKVVDLNSADAKALAKAGMSMKKAQMIVDYRTKNGNFKSVEDLKMVMNAKGKPVFTAAMIKKLQTHLTVGAAAPAPAGQ